ncbi:hypothetical protein PGT21_006276 [Puccinia graminis f. sp. tritici]|uniref:Uncharacterized protein n=1 Tax=Puccinia graminis f. sp. tritici TaxID=56615 RepID=A0A5B0MDZ1_PUCGR|nr:hypothetical protein PGTUg99_029330 [Puccinia graminis f. sp. tritici]KAA1090594.1 hypothetical protein PGT21_006276 [Puccinia graminis f. sp. tritici]
MKKEEDHPDQETRSYKPKNLSHTPHNPPRLLISPNSTLIIATSHSRTPGNNSPSNRSHPIPSHPIPSHPSPSLSLIQGPPDFEPTYLNRYLRTC